MGDPGLIPGSGRSPGEIHSNPLQYSCLENSMGSGAWWTTVHGVAKSRAQLSHEYFPFQTNETKAKDKQMELHQTKQFLHIKENYQQNEKAAYKKWKKIFANDTLNKGLNTQNIQRTHKIQHQKTKSGQRISTDIFPKIYRYPTDIKDTQHY